MGIKVMKFGGTSVGNHFAMEQVFRIVQKNASGNKLIVVLSACSGVTDSLLKIAEKCLSTDSSETEKLIENLEANHLHLVVELFKNGEKTANCIRTVNFIFESLKKLVEGVRILGELTPKVTAEILSYGEILSSTIFYQFLINQGLLCFLLDAREVIFTDGVHLNAKPDLKKIAFNSTKLANYLKNYNIIITQGFIGSWAKETTTLGRGGSDLSAALFGYCIGADEVQIWTDVDGVLTADPKIVDNPKTLSKMVFEEVVELSFYGAKVLHPETIKPAISKNIPVRVLNTFNPEGEGTLIISSDKMDAQTGVFHSAVYIGNSYYLSKRLDTHSKSVDYYFNLLKHNFPDLIRFSGNRNNFRAIVKEHSLASSFNELCESEKIDCQRVEVIAIVGNQIQNLQQAEKDKLTYILETYSINLFICFPVILSNYSLLLLVNFGQGKMILPEIHSILFS